MAAMAFTSAWRNFKRMQDLTVAAAGLIYAAAVVHALGQPTAGTERAVLWTVLWPAAFLGFSLAIPLLIAPIRRWLTRYVWMSFQGGFGQTVGSVLFGVFLLFAVGVFFYLRATWNVVAGFVGANVFSAYAAGIGILAVQAILVRDLEQVPEVRALIEERG
jgi:hypothetical protein